MIDFWTAVLALTLILYVLLDGFDLGVGILFGLAKDEAQKKQMLNAISPVWDGNETWLVLTGTILFGAFPVVYSLVLSAFYIPIIIMLSGLIFRGVAFEFREKSVTRKQFWDLAFSSGSLVATFVQGAAIGAMVLGIENQNGRFVGGPFDWLSPFSILCGLGLCLGYGLLGAGWLVKKTNGAVREMSYSYIPRLLAGVLIFVVLAFCLSLAMELPVMHRWIERPILIIFPLIGIASCYLIYVGVKRRSDGLPYFGAALLFLAAYGTLALSFLPYIIPFSITLQQAAAPHSSLAFMFWGAGVFVLPITLIYTLLVYSLFKGKAPADDGYH